MTARFRTDSDSAKAEPFSTTEVSFSESLAGHNLICTFEGAVVSDALCLNTWGASLQKCCCVMQTELYAVGSSTEDYNPLMLLIKPCLHPY